MQARVGAERERSTNFPRPAIRRSISPAGFWRSRACIIRERWFYELSGGGNHRVCIRVNGIFAFVLWLWGVSCDGRIYWSLRSLMKSRLAAWFDMVRVVGCDGVLAGFGLSENGLIYSDWRTIAERYLRNLEYRNLDDEGSLKLPITFCPRHSCGCRVYNYTQVVGRSEKNMGRMSRVILNGYIMYKHRYRIINNRLKNMNFAEEQKSIRTCTFHS